MQKNIKDCLYYKIKVKNKKKKYLKIKLVFNYKLQDLCKSVEIILWFIVISNLFNCDYCIKV